MPYIDYAKMPAHSRVWVYQSTRTLTSAEVEQANAAARQFVEQWTSHQRDLAAWGGALLGRFVVLAVDEQKADASGCSIDKSVHFMQTLGTQLRTDFFNRMNFAYIDPTDNNIKSAESQDFSLLYSQGKIKPSTLVFNNLVQTKAELEQRWRIPLAESWHRNFVK